MTAEPARRKFSSPWGRAASEAVLGRDKAHDCVYFIQDTVGGQIKIGWTAHVRRRLSELQPGNPHPLKIIATMPGGQKDERKLHLRFAWLRVYGEWFLPGQDLLDFIKELKESRHV